MSTARPTFRQVFSWRLEAAAYDLLSAGLRLLPVEWVSAFGGAALRLIGPLTGLHRLAVQNLAIAFPDLDPQMRRRLLAAQWDNIGRTFFEFPLTDRLTPASGRIEIQGRERLEAVARAGEGAILVSGHFANWEVMAAVIVDCGVRCRVTYRAANNPYIDARIVAARARYGVELFASKGSADGREVLESLQGGEAVAFLNDQKFNTGVDGRLFGAPVRTAGGPTRLALRFGGRLHPMSVQRLPRARFRVVIHPPIELVRTGDRARDLAAGVAALNAFFEARIRERPSEWFWIHKRWPAEVYAELGAVVERGRRSPLSVGFAATSPQGEETGNAPSPLPPGEGDPEGVERGRHDGQGSST